MQSSNPLRYFVSEVHLRSPHQHAKFYQHIHYLSLNREFIAAFSFHMYHIPHIHRFTELVIFGIEVKT